MSQHPGNRPPSHLPIEPERPADHVFRLLVDSVLDDGIFMLDPKENVLSWNRMAEHFTGCTAEEIVGQHFSRFYPVEDVEGGKPDHELEVAAEVGRSHLGG